VLLNDEEYEQLLDAARGRGRGVPPILPHSGTDSREVERGDAVTLGASKGKAGAGDGARTRDLHVGNVELYH
jgi:hypothetical protein